MTADTHRFKEGHNPPMPDAPSSLLYELLDHLAQHAGLAEETWQGWRIVRITGGANNLLYRATGPAGDLAVKFAIRDGRDRAGREYASLVALQQASLAIAPEPVLLDRQRYAQPVVVQTWLDGEVTDTPPTSDAAWLALLQHYAALYAVTPEQVAVRLPQAVVNAASVEAGRELVRQQVARIPQDAQPESLRALIQRFERYRFPGWPAVPRALCRVDGNTLNFVRRPQAWASVDWENSGWGDPVFEIADLQTHPAYLDVPPARWGWVADAYCRLIGNPAAALRIEVYHKIMLVWWVARLARYLYEIPRGLDERLVEWRAGWQANIQAKYERYLQLAEALLQ